MGVVGAQRRPTHQPMRLLRLLCLGLFAGQAKGAACALGVVGDFFNEVAGVDKSFHRKLPKDPSRWGKYICGVLKLTQSAVDVTLGIDVSWWKLAFLSKADQKIVVSGICVAHFRCPSFAPVCPRDVREHVPSRREKTSMRSRAYAEPGAPPASLRSSGSSKPLGIGRTVGF